MNLEDHIAFNFFMYAFLLSRSGSNFSCNVLFSGSEIERASISVLISGALLDFKILGSIMVV